MAALQEAKLAPDTIASNLRPQLPPRMSRARRDEDKRMTPSLFWKSRSYHRGMMGPAGSQTGIRYSSNFSILVCYHKLLFSTMLCKLTGAYKSAPTPQCSRPSRPPVPSSWRVWYTARGVCTRSGSASGGETSGPKWASPRPGRLKEAYGRFWPTYLSRPISAVRRAGHPGIARRLSDQPERGHVACCRALGTCRRVVHVVQKG